jgi:hypothetical protein
LSLREVAVALNVPLRNVEGWLAGTAPEQHDLSRLMTLLDARTGGELSTDPTPLHEAPEPPRSGGMSMKQFLNSGWHDLMSKQDEIGAIDDRIAQLQQRRSIRPRGVDDYGAVQHVRRIDREIAAERDKRVKAQGELQALSRELEVG